MSNAKQIDFLKAGILDASGNSLALGLVYTYEAGTNITKKCWTNATKADEATNPIELDGYGQATVYGDGNYKFVIKTAAGVTIATVDNFYYSIPTISNRQTIEVSADYTASTDDYLIVVNTANGNVTINLPTAIGNEGLEYIITKSSSDGNSAIIDPYLSQTISGVTTKTLANQYYVCGLISDGVNWQETLNNSNVMTLPRIYDSASDHQYIFAVNNLTANRTVTLPLLTGNDEFVFKDHIQTLTNKTIIDPLFKGLISGLGVSNAADTEHDITIATGACYDSTNADEIILASALTKQADAEWSVGTNAGGMASGETLPTSGTIHVWLIKRSDTGVVDVMFNNHATTGLTPTLPTDYDYKRRIFSLRTDASANIINGDQWGTSNDRTWLFDTPILDINTTNPGTSAVTRALSTPGGIAVMAQLVALCKDASTTAYWYLSSLDNTDMAASATAAPLNTVNGIGAGDFNVNPARIKTDTSSQIRSRLAGGGASTTIAILTLGWEDSL